MTRVASPSGEYVPPTPRKSMGPARRARILKRQDGQCAYPACEVTVGIEIDHIVCLELGGRDTDDNCEGLCVEHHKQKTARDLKLIAKARRCRLKDRGEFPAAKQKLRGRGFEKRWVS
jgi:5-methylcytosine-specific restriction endonuclease McrA